MKKWQRYWLYINIFIFSLHFMRDIFQAFGMRNIISTFFESPGPPKVSPIYYYTIYNTVAYAVIEVVLSIRCLRRNSFGLSGRFTIILAMSLFVLWLVYYYIL